jgi:hypothetical protein
MNPADAEQNPKTLDEAREAATAKSDGRICRPGGATAKPAPPLTRPGGAPAKPAPAAVTPAAATVPATVANDNHRHGGFGMVAMPTEAPQGVIVGSILKFRKGEFGTNRGATALPPGTELIARDVSEAWVRFDNGALVETIVRSPDRPFPSRSELGHLDRAKWPPGPDGKPADPWSHQFYMLFFNPETMEDLTFITSTSGGERAVRQLSRQIDYRREISGVPDLLARVELAVSRWSSKKYGVILSPDFPIQGWVDSDLRPAPDLKLADEIDDSVAF